MCVCVVLGTWKSIFGTFEGEDLKIEGEVSRTLQVRINGSQCKGPRRIANPGDFVCVSCHVWLVFPHHTQPKISGFPTAEF